MINSNRGRTTHRLRDIFPYRGWKSSFSSAVFVDPLAEERPAISTQCIHRWKVHQRATIPLLTIWVYRHSF